MAQPMSMKQTAKPTGPQGTELLTRGSLAPFLNQDSQRVSQLVSHLVAGARLMCWSRPDPVKHTCPQSRVAAVKSKTRILPLGRSDHQCHTVSHWTSESPTIYLLDMLHLLSNRRKKLLATFVLFNV
ncbi:hypothetical protein HJG60_007847 [Phyllostomus discolor]|uniref:Uncharacterized protein n=1 Tax=Phyllostomus discolor TaxID=89673 RepID=A0A834BHH2_9CHIR|nr:hypothetical protein HJG60_007847 [Phyllostomus discolor]